MNKIIPAIIEIFKNGLSANDVNHYMFGVPTEVGDLVGLVGTIFVAPVTTDLNAETTGVLDRRSEEIEIILATTAKMDVYENPTYEGAMGYITRIMDGKNADGSPRTDSITYLLRSNFRNLGLRQPRLTIDWNDRRFEKEGIVAATLRLTQETIESQPII